MPPESSGTAVGPSRRTSPCRVIVPRSSSPSTRSARSACDTKAPVGGTGTGTAGLAARSTRRLYSARLIVTVFGAATDCASAAGAAHVRTTPANPKVMTWMRMITSPAAWKRWTPPSAPRIDRQGHGRVKKAGPDSGKATAPRQRADAANAARLALEALDKNRRIAALLPPWRPRDRNAALSQLLLRARATSAVTGPAGFVPTGTIRGTKSRQPSRPPPTPLSAWRPTTSRPASASWRATFRPRASARPTAGVPLRLGMKVGLWQRRQPVAQQIPSPSGPSAAPAGRSPAASTATRPTEPAPAHAARVHRADDDPRRVAAPRTLRQRPQAAPLQPSTRQPRGEPSTAMLHNISPARQGQGEEAALVVAPGVSALDKRLASPG